MRYLARWRSLFVETTRTDFCGPDLARDNDGGGLDTMNDHMDDDVATKMFRVDQVQDESTTAMVLGIACSVLKGKGVDPVKQISGFVMSGDPSYIPRNRDARNLIKRMDRCEIVKELVSEYLKAHKQL